MEVCKCTTTGATNDLHANEYYDKQTEQTHLMGIKILVHFYTYYKTFMFCTNAQ